MRNDLALTGLLLMGAWMALWSGSSPATRATQADDPQPPALEGHRIGVLEADVATLNDKAPDQAHAMISVAYNFNNMWFAAKAENWPLAQFYWNETRSHLRWAVRIIPVRKDHTGAEVKLADILEALENAPLKQLQEAIEAKNHEKFVAAYRFTLENCYACHKASDKPYLRLQIPERPAEASINFDPEAKWPK